MNTVVNDIMQRYSRQIRLPGFGLEAQQRLLNTRVLIIGMGGLGSPASLYLASAGVGHLVLNDFDRVELSNLQRQIVHREESIGESKAISAADTLKTINSSVQITAIDGQLDDDELNEEIRRADVVLDCSDNFETRFAINACSVAQRTPLVSGAAIRLEGQLSSFDPQRPDSPCYHCLYGDEEGYAETCEMEGVLSPVVGVIGTLQALEAVKLITAIGQPLVGKLLLFDALSGQFQTLGLPRDPHCPVCAARL